MLDVSVLLNFSFFLFFFSPSALYRAPSLRQLEDVSNVAETAFCRLSCYGLLLFARSNRTKAPQQSECSRNKWNLIVTDKSLQKAQQNWQHKESNKDNGEYSFCVKVNVIASHVVDNSETRILGKRGVRLFLKDLLYSNENNGRLSIRNCLKLCKILCRFRL